MIAKPQWFSLRKYGGWGLTPKTWQGWIYILVFILIISLISILNINENLKNTLTITAIFLIIIDVVHTMTKIKKDERERLHEALADRNALWVLITVLVIGILIKQVVDPIIIIALLLATLAKGLTFFYYKDK